MIKAAIDGIAGRHHSFSLVSRCLKLRMCMVERLGCLRCLPSQHVELIGESFNIGLC